jgi:glycosyltransferase involved in cell wall biosynthesis
LTTLIDVTRLLDRRGRWPTGIDRVCQAYIEHYGHGARAVIHRGHLDLIASPAVSRRLFDELAGALPSRRWSFDRITALRALVASAWDPPAAGSWLIHVGHAGLERPGMAAWVRARRLRPVYMLHDLIPITHPEYCVPGVAATHARRVATMLRTAACVVANSAATLESLRAYAARTGQAVPPALACPIAPRRLPPGDAAPPLSSPYFVVLGTIEPRKNHLLPLHIWRELATRAAPPRLVVIGQRGWECENVVDMLERCAAIRPFVVERGDCDDAEMATYVRHARALLLPSFVEGYGLPLAEALSLGAPVIASDLAVFREVAGDIPDYLSPLDAVAWMRLIAAYAEPESAPRSAQLERLRGWRAPSWEAHFSALDAFLARL